MSIDIQGIERTLMGIIQDAVGGDLSDLGTSGNKSILQARQLYSIKGKLPPTPPYPYITINLTGIEENNGWRQGEYLDDNENLVSTSNKELSYTIRVFGSAILDEGTGELKVATEIANDAHSYFRLPHVIETIGKDTTGELLSVGDVDPVPQLSGGDYIESAIFNLTISATDTITSTASGVFDTVETDVELRLTDEDPSPLEFTITNSDV